MPKEGMEASRVVLGPLYAQFLGFVEPLRLVEVDLTDHSLKNLGSPKVLLSLADLLWQTLCIVSACNNHSPLHQTYFPSRDEDLFQMLTFHHGLETCA
jgi:hypothetical protein